MTPILETAIVSGAAGSEVEFIVPTFVAGGPLVPDELVQDLEDDRVVLFCGAGISRGAGLPDYNGLVRDAFDAMGVAAPSKRDRRWVWPDRLLGDLEARSQPGAVRAAVASVLGRPPRDVVLHKALLRLAKLSRHPGLRLVTTNFDTYFESADPTLRPGLDLHSGPVLPIPRDDRAASWRSVVHLHGRLEQNGNDDLIMTSADFGRAYLTDGWAARFVGRLFADFSVLFVGYSLNDPVLRYMTDAFATEALVARRKSTRPTAYIFVSYQGKAPPTDAQEDWRQRGLEPIFYHHGRRHRLLRETIVAWAAARDDWLSSTATLVSRLSTSPPAGLDPSEVSNLLWALFGRPQDDGYGARVFAQLAPSPPVEWLQVFDTHESELVAMHQKEVDSARSAGTPQPPAPLLALRSLSVRPGYADPPLNSTSLQLARWLCTHVEDDALIDWVTGLARVGRRLHPHLRSLIRHKLGQEVPALIASKRRFWRLVSSEAPWMERGTGAEQVWDLPDLMKEGGGDDLVRAELIALLRPYLRLGPSTWRMHWAELRGVDDAGEPAEPQDRFSLVADAEVDLAGEDQLRFALEAFNKLADADARLAAMADDLTSLLKQALDLWALVGEAGPEDDPSLHHQPSIEPHPQNQHFQHWTALIDLLWRGWVHMDTSDGDASRRLVDRWRSFTYPTFGRMGLAAIGRSTRWAAEEKLTVLMDGL